MLVCLSCNIEFKEDKKFCSYCGGRLVTKENPASDKKGSGKEEEESKEKLICPSCKMIYEFGSSCIQCGSALVAEIPMEEKEESLPSQPKQAGNPDEGLICPACKVTYSNGNFCPKCGSPLFSQKLSEALEEANATLKPESAEQEQAFSLPIIKNRSEMPRKNLICPQCKIIYERGSTCVRCGSSLVVEGQESEKLEPPVISDQDLDPSCSQIELSDSEQDPEKQVSPPSSLKSREVEGLRHKTERIDREELELFSDRETDTTSEKTKEATTDIPERKSFHPKKSRIDYRRLFFESGSVLIMVLAAGYLLWSIYSHFIKVPEPKVSRPEQVSLPARSNPPNPLHVTAQVPVPQGSEKENAVHGSAISKETETETSSPSSPISSDALTLNALEATKIKDLLEQIRQANLQKDIDLFMSCYASEFKDRDGKKKSTLSFWKKFDYLELSYDLKKSSVTGDTARVKIEWTIKISAKTGGPAQESKTFLDALLRREDASWKIQEVKQAS